MKMLSPLFCLWLVSLTVACTESPSAVSTDHEPLIIAAEAGDLDRLTGLLSKQAEVDTRDSCHWTPLMKAAVNGHQAVADRLLSAGASPDLTDNGGYSALMLAASNNHHALVEALLQQGANPNMQEMTRGWSALIWAAKRGHRESVEALIQAGAAIGIRDFQGKNAVDWARQNSHDTITRLLLEYPAHHAVPLAIRPGKNMEEIRHENQQ